MKKILVTFGYDKYSNESVETCIALSVKDDFAERFVLNKDCETINKFLFDAIKNIIVLQGGKASSIVIRLIKYCDDFVELVQD